MKNNAHILFFVKYPEPGEVKTRLAARIGADKAAELYGNFVLDILAKLESTQLPFTICLYPEQKKELLKGWLGEGYAYILQKGADVGERMASAFLEAFAGGHSRVILIGSDFPDLPQSFLEESLGALSTHDAVIGPATDGGYYLIGFRDRTFSPQAFEGMQWGTEVVFKKTLSIMRDRKQQVYILPAWSDVDTLEDLKELVRRSQGTGFSNSRTMTFLSQLKIL